MSIDEDAELRHEVYERARRIARRRRQWRGAIAGVAVVTAALLIAFVGNGTSSSRQTRTVASTTTISPQLKVTVSDLSPSVGEEITISTSETGGVVVYSPLIATGDPRQQAGAPALGYACGAVSPPEARRTTYRWTYGTPGTYEVRVTQAVADPCTPNSTVLLEQTATVTVRGTTP